MKIPGRIFRNPPADRSNFGKFFLAGRVFFRYCQRFCRVRITVRKSNSRFAGDDGRLVKVFADNAVHGGQIHPHQLFFQADKYFNNTELKHPVICRQHMSDIVIQPGDRRIDHPLHVCDVRFRQTGSDPGFYGFAFPEVDHLQNLLLLFSRHIQA